VEVVVVEVLLLLLEVLLVEKLPQRRRRKRRKRRRRSRMTTWDSVSSIKRRTCSHATFDTHWRPLDCSYESITQQGQNDRKELCMLWIWLSEKMIVLVA
jgi:hypothetical protein